MQTVLTLGQDCVFRKDLYIAHILLDCSQQRKAAKHLDNQPRNPARRANLRTSAFQSAQEEHSEENHRSQPSNRKEAEDGNHKSLALGR